MLWVIAESGKLKKTKVRRNLIGARSLEGLGTLGRLGLEGLLLFMYPTWKASVSFSITHRVLSLYLHLSSLNLCHLISSVDVILFGVNCLSIQC